MTTDTVGGVWTYAVELARALRPAGIEVLLATMGAPVSGEQRAQVAPLSNVTLAESTYKLEWMEDPADDTRRAGDWLLDLEAEFRPDVVHLNGYAHGAWPFRAPVMVVGHSCVMSWWRRVRGADAPPEFAWYRRAVPAGLHAADLVVAPTRAMLNELHHHYGRLRRTRVINNARNPRLYHVGEKEDFILAAGRVWDEAKNIPALRRVAPGLPWPVCVAGETRHADASGGTADTHDLLPLGRLSEPALAGWYARAAIYCLPARYEPFGLSALEAALSGCALVLGDIPSLREVWGDAATFVAPDDPAALLDALARLITDRGLRQAQADRARHHSARYAPERMADEYLSAYRGLVAQHRSVEVAAPAVTDAPAAAHGAYGTHTPG